MSATNYLEILLISVLVVGAGACRQPSHRERDRKSRPDVILVTIDTLRADRVGAAGGRADVTPTLDAIARTGVAFTDATAHVPLTLPSHASILTGRYPTSHGLQDNEGAPLSGDIPTLATLAHAAGYHTAAFVGSFVLRRTTGLARGFDVYDDQFEGVGRTHLTLSSLERRAPEVARRAGDWLRTAQSPYFLWVHFYDPHAPYDPPPAFASRFPGRPYDAEVATADFGVSALLDAIGPDRRKRALVVVTGDHGEGLGEHGESEHGMLLYDATLHVPLIIAGPGVPAGLTVRHQVRHVDVLPTMLAFTGIEPPAHLDGHSLLPLAELDRSDPPPSYAESHFGALHFGWSPLRSVRDGTWKFIEAPAPELYSLRDDPGERDNRYSKRADLAAAMTRALPKPAQERGGTSTPAADAAERLRSLGYVTGRVTIGGAEGQDPKEQIGRYEAYVRAFNQGLASLEEGRPREAVKLFRDLARSFPRSFEAHQYLGRALAATGAYDDATVELDTAVARGPDVAALYFDEARVLADAKQLDRAFARLAEGRRLEPSAFYGALTEGLLARKAGQPARAEQALREALRLNPALSVAHFELGRLAEDRGDRAAARAEYQSALDLDATLDEARRALDRVTNPR
jgi:arylsulfatase A-like enzyme/Flp pilus assembly protein TadD